MSGAAGIAAAKNRRSRADPVRTSVVDCKSINGTCATKNINQSQKQQQQPQQTRYTIPTMENALVDPISMKILGPMPTLQVLKIHEQRLNRIDEQVTQFANRHIQAQQNSVNTSNVNSNNDYTERIECMEDKIRMLEEVIMNLQLTITNVQGFAMETNMTMMKMKREQEEKSHEISVPKHHSEVEQVSTPNIDIDVSVHPLPSSHSSSISDLTDIIDTIHNDEIVVSNITYALNNGY